MHRQAIRARSAHTARRHRDRLPRARSLGVVGRRSARSVSMLAAVAVALVTTSSLVARPDDPARASADVARLTAPARASAPAVRGTQTRIGPAPPPARCARVAVIGDSLMDNARWYLQTELGRAGYDHVIDAQPSRRIPDSVRAPYSGVTAARVVRTTWGEADCWVIALGSNDLIFGAGDATVAASLIDSMLAAVTPGARAWWVNLDYHLDPAVPFDFVRATSVFNDRLAARAAGDPGVTVIDWYSLAERNPGWFFDPVHVDGAGSRARAEQVVAALGD